jgi:hypothetical protein
MKGVDLESVEDGGEAGECGWLGIIQGNRCGLGYARIRNSLWVQLEPKCLEILSNLHLESYMR